MSKSKDENILQQNSEGLYWETPRTFEIEPIEESDPTLFNAKKRYTNKHEGKDTALQEILATKPAFVFKGEFEENSLKKHTVNTKLNVIRIDSGLLLKIAPGPLRNGMISPEEFLEGPVTTFLAEKVLTKKHCPEYKGTLLSEDGTIIGFFMEETLDGSGKPLSSLEYVLSKKVAEIRETDYDEAFSISKQFAELQLKLKLNGMRYDHRMEDMADDNSFLLNSNGRDTVFLLDIDLAPQSTEQLSILKSKVEAAEQLSRKLISMIKNNNLSDVEQEQACWLLEQTSLEFGTDQSDSIPSEIRIVHELFVDFEEAKSDEYYLELLQNDASERAFASFANPERLLGDYPTYTFLRKYAPTARIKTLVDTFMKERFYRAVLQKELPVEWDTQLQVYK